MLVDMTVTEPSPSQLVARYNPGDGIVQLRTDKNLNDGNWHRYLGSEHF